TAQPSLTPDDESAVKDILGYLNFSSGAADPRFQKSFDRLHRWLAADDGTAPLQRGLAERLDELASSSSGFQNSEQARSVIALVFDRVIPAYREHHSDLLFHVPAEEFYQPFFVARVVEAVLSQGPPWSDTGRIADGAVRHLNSFLGHRPVAVL